MSKVDAQRAMREAKYAALRASQPATPPPARPAVTRPAAGPVSAWPAPDPAGPPTADAGPPAAEAGDTVADEVSELCGHRSIGNKSCTRPAGHSEKNHRYS